MVVSSYSRGAPFFTYLTLFQSRTAVINLVLPLTSTAAQSIQTVNRKLVAILKQKTEIGTRSRQDVLEYLRLKKFVAKECAKRGRYPGIAIQEDSGALRVVDASGTEVHKLPVYQVDLWMADPAIRSLTGVPTPENIDETLELCYALGIITSQTISWTSPGQIAASLRQHSKLVEPNPFVLGPEIVIILRQLIERDGIMLASMLTELVAVREATILRDQFSLRLPQIADLALERAKTRGCSSESLREGKKFVKLVEDTGKKRAKMSQAPGVLEHRVTPRLEWLTDIGALSKEGLAKNGFAYRVTADALVLRDAIEGWMNNSLSADDAALSYWQKAQICVPMRALFASISPREAFLAAYVKLKRPIGPVAIRDVCLVAGMGLQDRAWSMPELETELLAMARAEKGINLSGGRYKREAEFIHIKDEVLRGQVS